MESLIVTREKVERFLSIIGKDCRYSDDDIYYGDDSGYGYGFGSGYGYVDGNGYGYGFGPRHDDGSGYGLGKGCGAGRDDNSGRCNGYGNGGIKALNGNTIDYIDGVPTIIKQVRSNIACGYIVKDDLTLSPCFIAKVGNSFAHGKTLKGAVADAENKEIERLPTKERIKTFREHFGNLDSEHTGREFYDWHHILTGSCRMGRDEFCKANEIDLEKKYTVRYFLQITGNSYGCEIIKKVSESYERKEK